MIHLNPLPTLSKGIKATSIALAEEEQLVLKKALISRLSPFGFTLVFHKHNFISDSFRLHTYFYDLWQKEICIYIPDMEMDLEGVITDVRYLKPIQKGQAHSIKQALSPKLLLETNKASIENEKWEICVQFSSSIPQYWLECLYDLWPTHSYLS